MSPRVTLRLIGAFAIWWIGYALAELLGGRGAVGGVLIFVALAAVAIVVGVMKKGKP